MDVWGVLIAVLPGGKNKTWECIICTALETTGPCNCEVYFLSQAISMCGYFMKTHVLSGESMSWDVEE